MEYSGNNALSRNLREIPMKHLLTILASLTMFLVPVAVSAQTVGDATQLSLEANTAAARCPEEKPTVPGRTSGSSNQACTVMFASIALEAGRIAMRTISAFGERCVARMARNRQDSNCGEQYFFRRETIALEPTEISGYLRVKTSLVEAKKKKF
jgi:hypothetical protein